MSNTIAAQILAKPGLRQFYTSVYARYLHCLARCPKDGQAIELGSGYGFLRTITTDITPTDVTAYDGIDHIEDARKLSFPDNSLRAIFMLNTLHHIPDAELFFQEAQRCLVPGGRILIVDHYPGVISAPIYKWLHHEPWLPKTPAWQFASHNPYRDGNAALAWIIFFRDRKTFLAKFPYLTIASVSPNTPLLYWLSGGLKSWTLISRATLRFAIGLDTALMRISPRFGSFMDIEIVKK